MINQLLAPFIIKYVREFLGDWDLVGNLKISSLMVPEVNLTNVPLPQYIFDLAELPLVVCQSNIGRVQAKFSWGTVLGESVESACILWAVCSCTVYLYTDIHICRCTVYSCIIICSMPS